MFAAEAAAAEAAAVSAGKAALRLANGGAVGVAHARPLELVAL